MIFYISRSPLFSQPNFVSLTVCTLDLYLNNYSEKRQFSDFSSHGFQWWMPRMPKIAGNKGQFWEKKLSGWPPIPNIRGYLYHSLFRFYFENIEDLLPKFPKKIDHKNSFRLPHIAGNRDQFLKISLGMTPKSPSVRDYPYHTFLRMSWKWSQNAPDCRK